MFKREELGLTLVELMITLAVATILVGLAAPSFRTMIQSNRLTSHVNELVSSLSLARSEAVKRSVQVRMSATTPGATNEWGNGWTVWIDLDGDGVIDDSATDEEVLRKVDSIAAGLVFDSDPEDRDEYIFRPDSSIGFTEILYLCESKTGENGRKVEISPSGRVSVSDHTCS